MKINIIFLSAATALSSFFYLASYTALDTVTLRNGKKVELLQLSPDTDAGIFRKGKEVFVQTFKEAYSNFSAEDLYLKDEPDFLTSFLDKAFEDEENDFENKRPNAHFLVARVVGTQEVIGFVAHDIDPETKQAYIRQLAIAPQEQGQGLGKKMTLGVITKIAAGTQKVVVCTRRINQQAKEFYTRLGFIDSDMERVHPQLSAVKYQGFELSL